MTKTNYYGVSQFHYGHEYRYIFDEDTLSKNIYNNEPVPDKDCIDCSYPIGGSNSSATFIEKLNTNDDIKNFLTSPADGPDLEDPMLIDIGEYLLTVDNDNDSCTDIFMKKFNLDYDKLTQYDDIHLHKKNVKIMFNILHDKGYIGLDYSNPFYGNNSHMKYSELCEIAIKNNIELAS